MTCIYFIRLVQQDKIIGENVVFTTFTASKYTNISHHILGNHNQFAAKNFDASRYYDGTHNTRRFVVPSSFHYSTDTWESVMRDGENRPTPHLFYATSCSSFTPALAQIREALAALELLGIVETRGGSGTYLRATTSELLPQTFTWNLLLSRKETRDLAVLNPNSWTV
ncbi:hypothetical protein [Actinotignum urinale]|uniref:hypothetical protein n=1 Tax=Actinotignum urinale TaxID=190146 RepID=UPI0003B4D8EF|nr:hypothetical protein [Actinotignum urinale]MDY5159807.1 hypothetical protein [Actinotignum urinale]